MANEIRVGLIGYGYAGRTFHAPVISCVPSLLLTKVMERKSKQSKERYPWVEVVDDVNELFNDNEIDLVVVATRVRIISHLRGTPYLQVNILWSRSLLQ
ncbi:Gfo/Idh/MocA family oxidoreductase [Candidatus Pristimantibacillus sp. PTI5]|uniref:Gfo/Idh/MocA family oxidoreductase n=1 Tax=Candidatus Pristimantibacillus sp. PTI5 TaxID=3400422 RepID=UPI003B012656